MMMADAVKLHSSGYADIFLKDGICKKCMVHNFIQIITRDFIILLEEKTIM